MKNLTESPTGASPTLREQNHGNDLSNGLLAFINGLGKETGRNHGLRRRIPSAARKAGLSVEQLLLLAVLRIVREVEASDTPLNVTDPDSALKPSRADTVRALEYLARSASAGSSWAAFSEKPGVAEALSNEKRALYDRLAKMDAGLPAARLDRDAKSSSVVFVYNMRENLRPDEIKKVVSLADERGMTAGDIVSELLKQRIGELRAATVKARA